MKRTVRIFGRAVPIWLVLLAVVVFSAAAWGAVLWLTAIATFQADIAAPPAPMTDISDGPGTCVEAVVDAFTVTPPDQVTIDLSEFNDESDCEFLVAVDNLSPGDIYCTLDSAPVHDAFTFADNMPVTIPTGIEGQVMFYVDGNAETINYAGTSIGSLQWEFTCDDSP